MTALGRMSFAVLLFLSHAIATHAQALKIVERLASRAARAGGKQLAQEFGLVLRESDEVLELLARRSAPLADDVLTKRFERLLGVDDTLRAEFRALSAVEKRIVVELGEGVQAALRRYPDPGEALALIQKLDAGGLAQARTYGDFVLDGAHWLHSDEVIRSLKRSKLLPEQAKVVSKVLGLETIPENLQAEHMAPLWKSVIRKMGKGAGEFWRTYIQPHKGKWLAGGLLAAYLIMPEKFHDASGNLTEYAGRKLAEFGIAIPTNIMKGTLRGPVEAFKERYAEAPVTTVLATILTVCFLLLAIPKIRRLAWDGLIKTLGKGSAKSPNNISGFQFGEPFRE